MQPEHLDLKAVATTICTGIFLMKEGNVLYGLRHYTADKYRTVSVLTTPGGRCEVGETIGDNLVREIAEETGITNFAIEEFLGIVKGAKEGDILYVYKGSTQQEPTLMEPEKFSEWNWFPPTYTPENFINLAALELLQKNLKS